MFHHRGHCPCCCGGDGGGCNGSVGGCDGGGAHARARLCVSIYLCLYVGGWG